MPTVLWIEKVMLHAGDTEIGHRIFNLDSCTQDMPLRVVFLLTVIFIVGRVALMQWGIWKVITYSFSHIMVLLVPQRKMVEQIALEVVGYSTCLRKFAMT